MSNQHYPKDRPRYFAMKFIRLMVKECLAQELGPIPFMLLVIIATTEDAAGYRRSVSFYDEQLLPLLGVGSKSTISLARRKCVESGWLHFEPGHRGKASRYWVSIPTHSSGKDDLPTDEGDASVIDTINKPIIEQVSNGNRTETEQVSNGNRTLLPIPLPTPKPGTSIDEYQEQAKPRVLAETFVFFWTRKRGQGRTAQSSVEIESLFAEHLRRHPGNYKAIKAEIESPGRDRNEWPGDLLKRFEGRARKTPHSTGPIIDPVVEAEAARKRETEQHGASPEAFRRAIEAAKQKAGGA